MVWFSYSGIFQLQLLVNVPKPIKPADICYFISNASWRGFDSAYKDGSELETSTV
jgi:hypothetical protein